VLRGGLVVGTLSMTPDCVLLFAEMRNERALRNERLA